MHGVAVTPTTVCTMPILEQCGMSGIMYSFESTVVWLECLATVNGCCANLCSVCGLRQGLLWLTLAPFALLSLPPTTELMVPCFQLGDIDHNGWLQKLGRHSMDGECVCVCGIWRGVRTD